MILHVSTKTKSFHTQSTKYNTDFTHRVSACLQVFHNTPTQHIIHINFHTRLSPSLLQWSPREAKSTQIRRNQNMSHGGRTRVSSVVVVLNIYDLSPANDYLYPIGFGLHHSGVEILGVEYSFASGGGIFESRPKVAPGMCWDRCAMCLQYCFNIIIIQLFLQIVCASTL